MGITNGLKVDFSVTAICVKLQNLLIKEEFEAPSTCVENKSNAIEIRDAVFEWDDTIDGDVRKKKHSTKDANTANAGEISHSSALYI